jgi:hypothetical protein
MEPLTQRSNSVSDLWPNSRAAGCAALAVITLAVAALGWLLLGSRSVSVGQVALRFGGGALDRNNGQYKGVYGPGRHNMGLWDNVYPYPDTVRNFIFAGGEDADAKPVPCTTKSTDPSIPAGPRVDMTGQFLFHLDTGPVLNDFHRRYGVRYRAWEGFDNPSHNDGWAHMLNETFRPAAETVITAACRHYTVDDLSDQAKINQLEAGVGQTVIETLRSRMGGQFFCGPDFDRTRPQVCSGIRFQMKPVLPPTALTDAATRLAAAQRNLEAAKVEAKAIQVAKQQGLEGMAYVANECRKDPTCAQHMTFVAGSSAGTAGK